MRFNASEKKSIWEKLFQTRNDTTLVKSLRCNFYELPRLASTWTIYPLLQMGHNRLTRITFCVEFYVFYFTDTLCVKYNFGGYILNNLNFRINKKMHCKGLLTHLLAFFLKLHDKWIEISTSTHQFLIISAWHCW